MTAEVVNLRSVRKRKKRAEKASESAVNRAAFGRTKAEKELARARLALQQKALDKHKRDD